MSRRVQENMVASLLLCIFIGFVVTGLEFGPNARLVPLPMSILGMFLVGAQLIWQNFDSMADQPPNSSELLPTQDLKDVADKTAAAAVDRDSEHATRRELWAFGCIAIFLFLIVLLGPVLAIYLFCAGYLLLSRHYGARKAIITASIFTGTIYLLFVVGLQLQLYHGILEPFIDRY